jgi:N-acetylglucosamine-6-sulfatase
MGVRTLGGRAIASGILGALSLAVLIASPVPATAQQRSNLVVVMTDDQSLAQLRADVMPSVTRVFRDHGVEFTQYVTQPLCCPSRASFLTGQYPHNNGVFNNVPGYRGLVDKQNTLPVWLERAGYRTALAGKFLNRYTLARGLEPAPGFTSWFNLLAYEYYGARLSREGREVVLGESGGRAYADNALTRRAAHFVRHSSTRKRPFFLWLSYLAPHVGTGPHPKECPNRLPVPAPPDLGAFAGESLPHPPAFNEADVSDKPSFVQSLDPIDGTAEAARTTHWRCSLESLLAVDRGVDRVVEALKQVDEMKDTVLVFTSDNGFFAGEHRISNGKALPYEEAIRAPLLFHLPPALLDGAPVGRSIDLPVAGVDLAPTLLRLAGARPCESRGDCRVLDGRSLLPLIRDHDASWPADRGILTQLARTTRKLSDACAFDSIRSPTLSYTEYTEIRDPITHQCVATDQAELYDLSADPFQLDNLLSTDPTGSETLRAAMEARLDALRDCAGVAGRDPRPPGGHHCE